MRVSQYLFACLPLALAIPVNVDERDANLDKRVYVVESEVVWTTTTAWSTTIVWETPAATPAVGAAEFEGDESKHSYHVGTPKHTKHTKPTSSKYTPPAYTPPASTSAAPAPETSSSTPSPPPPSTPSTTSVYVAPTPTSTYVPPPPTTTSTYSPPPAPTTSSVYVAPTTSAAPAPAATSASSGSYSGSSGSSSSSSGAAGTESHPYEGEGTYYAVGMGSCGVTSSESEKVVAVGVGFMSKLNGINPNNNPDCGKEITISYKGVTQTAKIVDTCAGCNGPNDLDMSQILFECFASTDEGRLYGVEWWFN